MGARAKKLEDTVPGTRTLGLSRKEKTEVKIEASPKMKSSEKKKVNQSPKDHLQEHQRGAGHHSLGFREAFTLTKGKTYQLALLEGVSSNW